MTNKKEKEKEKQDNSNLNKNSILDKNFNSLIKILEVNDKLAVLNNKLLLP